MNPLDFPTAKSLGEIKEHMKKGGIICKERVSDDDLEWYEDLPDFLNEHLDWSEKEIIKEEWRLVN